LKPASIISICISLVLIIGGYFLCAHARSTAPNDAAIDGNTSLSEDGNVVTELTLTGQTFSKVDIDISNCKVEIHGGAEASSVTLVNFYENTYIAAAGEKVLTVSNQITLLDYINLDGTGVTFSGVWKTLRSFFTYDTSDAQQEIHIYLGNDAEISQISVAVDSGTTLRLVDIDRDCDISVKVTDSNAEISNVNVASMSVSGSGSEITIGNASATNFEYTAKNTKFIANNFISENLVLESEASDISLLNTDFRNITATLGTSNLIMSTKYDRTSYFRKIQINEGAITENETEIGQKDESAEELLGTLPGNMTIEVESGSINITFGVEILPPVVTEDTQTPAA